MKRLFDIVASTLALILLSPLLLGVALWILIDDGYPVLFRQKRVGKNGIEFKLLKFRSMRRNTEALGQLTVGGKDPRITKSGYILRRYKIDELPQLLNVFLGEMSIVGPRPEVPRYVAYYSKEMREVLSVRPGLTDPASIVFIDEDEVLGKSQNPEKTYIEEILPTKVEQQLNYVRKASFKQDLRLIFQTLRKLRR